MASHDSIDPGGVGAVADRGAVQAIARANGRAFSLYFVLLGAATFVLGMLLALLPFVWGLALGLAIFAACMVGLGVFISTHRATARAHMRHVRLFWGMWGVTMILTVLGVGLWTGHAWVGWVGGVAGLMQGAGVGHLIDREAARRASTPAPGSLD